MKKTLTAQVLIFSFLIAFASVAIAKMTQKGWKKTVTLPSGEVILDISGEWNVLYKGYGSFNRVGSGSDILTITQKGTTFIAIKQIGSRWVPKGAETIKGELDENGFKSVFCYIGAPQMDGTHIWEPCKWEISKRGNKVVLKCGERMKASLNRR